MPDPSHVFDLHHSSWQCQILNPLSEARDWTHNLKVPSQICFRWATTGTPPAQSFRQNLLRPVEFYNPWGISTLWHQPYKSQVRSSRHGAVVNESNWEPWGCGFGPCPCSVGWGSGVAVSCGVGRRRGSDPALLWLWCRPAAVALIQPLAWEPPYAVGVALTSK